MLQYQSLVFGHSIEHHSLMLKATTIEDGAEIGQFAIVETGAVVASGQIVPAHKAVHAQRARTERETDGSAQRAGLRRRGQGQA